MGAAILLGGAAHLYQMAASDPGLFDLLWICNTMLIASAALFLMRFHRSVNAAVFFWTALGSVTWLCFLVARPEQFRVTSLTSHVLVPLCSGWWLHRLGVAPGGWKWAAAIGEASFLSFVFFHPDRDLLFLFPFTEAGALTRVGAVVALQVYYGA